MLITVGGSAASGNYTLPNLYVISSFLEIAGYIFIVSSLIKVLKNGKKTK
jgi:hypothetical protein